MSETIHPVHQERPKRDTGKVLVLDDDAIARMILSRWTEHWHLQCDTFAHPDQLLAHLSTFDYDLAIIDFHLPNLHGVKVIEIIREASERYGFTMPVFALHSTDSEARARGRQAGVPYFLQKPLSVPELLFITRAALCDPTVPARDQAEYGGKTPIQAILDPHLRTAANSA